MGSRPRGGAAPVRARAEDVDCPEGEEEEQDVAFGAELGEGVALVDVVPFCVGDGGRGGCGEGGGAGGVDEGGGGGFGGGGEVGEVWGVLDGWWLWD